MSRSNWSILMLAVLVAAVGGWFQQQSRLAKVPAGVQVAAMGEQRPDLALKDIDGREHRLSEFKGRRVLLNFWASWCGPCLDEMPALARSQAKFGDQGAIVVGIAMDQPDAVRQFLAAHPVPYPILLGQLESPSTSLRFGNTAETLPFSVLLDGDGRVLENRRGALTPQQLETWLGPPSR
ncbi:peroxiredoxin family protein [Dyella tabacisoli]|uniref:TlpA family protein disulfide reductase n=1 Tax=Dyella tabacisoli TaxID=2282381 RepID=A0A369UMV9_9GAMM|nr:TlpA disulfide reductase family protein [Dyella tabacisoli]RDD82102.1 TlpA family protein disulfide reductase [Dyella tabacisoli]